jgi:hypothetical protein
VRTIRPLLIVALAAIVTACGGATSMSSDGAGGTPTSAPATVGAATGTPATEMPPATGTPATTIPTEEPAAETEAPTGEAGTEAPTAEATEDPATPEASGLDGAAAACSGSDANRSFFAAAADAVDWPVLCAVLPKGWFVSEGSYRKAGGGKLLVAYKGPGGATLSLSEGSFCASDDGCVPAGTDLGDASLGPLDGTLVGLDDGGFAIVVDRGLRPSWLMVAQGLDQPTTVALGAALADVGS